jgi:hypothetical protein
MNEREKRVDRLIAGDAGLGGLFEDLEQQAAGMQLAERDAELVDRARDEYAAVSFSSRVHASLGRQIALTLVDGMVVEGTLAEAGVDWCRVSVPTPQRSCLVRVAAVASASGMSARAVPEAARPALARLTFGSALHRMAVESQELLLHHLPTGRMRVRVIRIGADFVEAEPSGSGVGSSTATLVPFSAILAVRPA